MIEATVSDLHFFPHLVAMFAAVFHAHTPITGHAQHSGLGFGTISCNKWLIGSCLVNIVAVVKILIIMQHD